ncbi:hypothetical protein DAH55_03125 [Sphingomonas koreensis]|uniref:hypothetical protein n=1 Tax=Sphingomonas koreensis TaxID=93064 RepID=UPI00082FCBC6|nr:hypothetical protein [Sphingomonas koreensis]PJI89207.1 hypothetical protein BDW16_2515 [Sphingomonas koreensis]RSU59706.1 hypothetical protein DAH56_10365 [Sphingomonas koreensis]RSU70899.1 hypothetical protein DAH55_03125 [Sphingomonas koreensis]
MSYRVLASLAALTALAGCAGQKQAMAPTPRPVPAPVRVAAPTPPDGAAAGLTIPARLADGSYASPNRDLSASGAIWHLRAAFNVAALSCPDTSLVPAYNKLLNTQRQTLAAAHRALAAEHGGMAAFDPAMTRLYNYFAQPPVLARFCAQAGPLLHQAAALAPGAIGGFAGTAITAIDRPFGEFYARYDAYRADLVAWRAGSPAIAPRLTASAPAAPRLTYDRAVFTANTRVTGGRTALASR